jgi:hypothetical protein
MLPPSNSSRAVSRPRAGHIKLFIALPPSDYPLPLNDLVNILNQNFERVSHWLKDSKLVMNADKTKCIIFGSRHMLVDDPQLQLSISGIPIEQVKKAKLLGVLLDSQLSWSDHIDGIVRKMGRGLAMVRKCSPYLTSSLMGQVIQSLFFCHLHYCPIIWSAATKSDLNKLQLVQNRAARLVLKCSLRTNVLFMHSRLSWLSVKQKLHSSLIMFFRTIILNQSPDIIVVLLRQARFTVYCNFVTSNTFLYKE